MVLVQWLGTDIMYGLEILHKWEKRVENKNQKVFGANSYACRSCKGKTGWGGPFWPPSQIGLKNKWRSM